MTYKPPQWRLFIFYQYKSLFLSLIISRVQEVQIGYRKSWTCNTFSVFVLLLLKSLVDDRSDGTTGLNFENDKMRSVC